MSESNDGLRLYVPGRGPFRGPALGFTAMAIILGLVGVVGLAKCAFDPDRVAIQGTLGFGSIAVALWLFGLWRGRWAVMIEVMDDSLRITRILPFLARFRARDLPWRQIRRVQMTWLKAGNSFGPPTPCVQVDLITGARHYLLRGYSVDGLRWISDVLGAARGRLGDGAIE